MKIKAFAKINLTLDICGKREDGYHLLDSVMLSVDPADTVILEKANNITVTCSDNSLSNENNIAYKAADKFFNAVKIDGGVSIYIEKQIPQAAGMGGGSADAAAVICGLDRIYKTNLSIDKLCEIGLSVGADVPFCIVGGCARVQGIGEKIESLNDIKNLHFVIAKNGQKGSTGAMYALLDETEDLKNPCTEKIIKSLYDNDIKDICKNIGNDFIKVTGLYDMERIFAETNPLAVSLSGSGPSVFAVYSDCFAAKKAEEYVKKQGIKCFYAEPKKSGLIFE